MPTFRLHTLVCLLALLCLCAANYICEVPSKYSNEQLHQLTQLNCEKVTNHVAEFQRALDRGKDQEFGSNTQGDAWRKMQRDATALCGRANSLLSTSSTNRAVMQVAAQHALEAWGSVIMQGKECCIYFSSPWCVDQEWSTSTVVMAIPFLVLVALFTISWFSSWCGKRPDVLPATLDHELRRTESKPVGPTAKATATLRKDLEVIWRSSPLRELPSSEVFSRASMDFFVALYEVFDFQADSVKNQYEHFISLWRSQVAMVADRFIENWKEVNEDGLLEEALGDLHCELLDGFLSWRQRFLECESAGFEHTDGKVPPLGGGWDKICKKLGGEPPEQRLVPLVQLAEISTYLLCWGEAGNLRFMPEVIYFITELALKADQASAEELRSLGSGGGSSSRYLTRIVRPIYNVVFDEWYDHVDVNKKNDRDVKKLHDQFEAFLPPDVANYDDWNEFFCDPHSVVEGLLCADGKMFFDEPHAKRFSVLPRVHWQVSLQAAEVKSHRELHSLWGVFATTHRVWFLHALLFLCCVVWVTGDATKGPEGGLPLLGQSLATRFFAVCLVVPFHGLLWFFARQQVTGRAIWKNRSFPALLRKLLQLLLGALPLFTYALLRLKEDDHSTVGGLTWALLSCIHIIVTAGQLLPLLFVPIGLRHTCQLPKAVAWLMRPFSWLLGQQAGWMSWQPTPVPFCTRVMRYLFWTAIMAVKCMLWLTVLKSVFDASEGLHLSLIGRQSLNQIGRVYLTTNWLSSMLLWIVLWCTTFLLFIADTQLWFVLGGTLLGVATVLVQRGCAVVSYSTEDAMAKLPERFSKKVLTYCTNRHPGAVSQNFPAVWDRIIEFMRYEDKVDNALFGDLCFEAGFRGGQVSWEGLRAPIVDMARASVSSDGSLSRATASSATASTMTEASTLKDGSKSTGSRRVRLPHILGEKRACERCAMECCKVADPKMPTNADALWRFSALSRGLGLPMPRPFRAPYIPGITVLIPHYGETILTVKAELFREAQNIEVPLMDWLKARYETEFIAFTNRMQAINPDAWTATGTEWDKYSDEQWTKVAGWASMRMQTLWRTVAGMCLYHPALQVHYEVQRDKRSRMGATDVWNASDVFTCLVSMQMYKFFDKRNIDETNLMLDKFPDCLKIAFIDCEDKGGAGGTDLVHSRQARRYYSCLIDRRGKLLDSGRRVPHYRVELPGYPILGDGKGDNQNHAIPFMRGAFSQCIDANQGAYFEQMLLLPCALAEFRSHKRGDGLSKRIVGFPEHITSNFGSVGDFAATAEVAFGTILQRTYAVLGARMHYGHPDMMNKVFMMQQGGVSKATKTVNLSEDIFAGMDFTLRGEGRKIWHKEYFHLAKGRDLGFNTVLGFFSKLSSGTGEQVLTRQTFRLCQSLHLPETLAFWYAHGGYYFTQFFVSISMPLLVFLWLLALLSDCENAFRDIQHCDSGRKEAAEVVATMLSTMFSWMMLLFLVATSAPLFAEIWMEQNFKTALKKIVISLATLSPLMFIFQGKVIGSYITNEFRYGGATYVATGRGLPTERRPFIGEAEETGLKLKKVGGLYLDYANIAYYDGLMLLLGTVVIIAAGGISEAGTNAGITGYMMASLALTIISWLYAPFVFNPYQFVSRHFMRDLRALAAFFLEDSGRHWVDWYDRTQLKPGLSFQTIDDILFVSVAFFLAAWYGSLNLKIEAMSSIYTELGSTGRHLLYVYSLLPPIFGSLIYCCIVVLFESLMGCSSMFRRQYDSMIELRRERREKKRKGDKDASASSSDALSDSDAAAGGEQVILVDRADHPVVPRAPTRMKTRQFWDKCFAINLGIPLPVSALVVAGLDIAEAIWGLNNFHRLEWYNGLMAGLILKWAMLVLILFLMENVLRNRIVRKVGMLGLPLQLWTHSHKILRDILTSSIIFWALAPFVAFNSLNDFLCPGCSLHMLLIYRDPGHLKRKELLLTALPTNEVADEACAGDEEAKAGAKAEAEAEAKADRGYFA